MCLHCTSSLDISVRLAVQMLCSSIDKQAYILQNVISTALRVCGESQFPEVFESNKFDDCLEIIPPFKPADEENSSSGNELFDFKILLSNAVERMLVDEHKTEVEQLLALLESKYAKEKVTDNVIYMRKFSVLERLQTFGLHALGSSRHAL